MATVDGQRFASGQCVNSADAVDAIVESFLEESLALEMEAQAGHVSLMFALRTRSPVGLG
jgi:hypothetical protein